MEKLVEDLNLPGIGGQIIAYQHRSFKSNIKSVEDIANNQLDSITEDVFEWEVCFTIRGPDRRYNPGKINLSKHSVKRLKNYLEIGSQELLTLQETSFAGTFSKVVSPELFVPKIEIVAENGKAWTSLWVSSQTFAFPVKLTIDDLSIITAKLERLEEKGKQMVATLKRLCKNDTSATGCV